LFVCLLLTVHARATSNDSLNRAFDNCVFLHDSLSHELTLAHELMSLDSANVVEHRVYISLLENQIDELNIQKVQLESIINKQRKTIQSAEKAAKRQKLSKIITTSTVVPVVAVVGFVAGWYLSKIKIQ